MPTIAHVVAMSLGWAMILPLTARPVLAADAAGQSRRPVILRVNRDSVSRAGAAGHSTAACVQMPANVLVADADAKEVAVAPGAARAQLAFHVINVSTDRVTITAVQTSCGCTIAELPSLPLTLAPGAGVPIVVTMNVAGRTGVVAKTATLVSNRGMKTLLARVRIVAPGTPSASADAVPRHTSAGK